MLTRATVAKRLGRSIATVRRMEGHELHPWTDSRGVHQFDRAEVEQLADRSHAGDHRDDEFTAPSSDAVESIARLKLELANAREALRAASQRSELLEHQNRELRTTSIDALELVEVILGPETPYAVSHCLRDLKRQR